MKNRLTFLLLLFGLVGWLPEADAADYYWVGNGGNWNDLSHWASVSNGAGNAYTEVPGPDDDVFFDFFSFNTSNQVVTISTDASCLNLAWNNISGANMPELFLSSGIKLNVYGKLDLDADMNVDYDPNIPPTIVMLANSGATFGVSINGNTLPNIEFNSASGSWAITQDLAVDGDIIISAGEVDAGADSQLGTRIITADQFIVNGSGVVLDISRMDITASSLFSVSDVMSLAYEDVIVDGIVVINYLSSISTPSFQITSSNALDFGDLTLTGTNGELDGSGLNIEFHGTVTLEGTITNTILGGHTFEADLVLSAPGALNKLEAGSTQTFADGSTIVGTGANCNNYYYLQSTESGVAAIVSKPIGDPVEISRFYLQDIMAVQMGQFEATISIDLGNNTNWTILEASAKTYRWVNGTGNWSDESHWMLIGGSTGCLPTALDDVIFDETSFSSTNQTVTVDLPEIYFNNMTWEDPQQGGRDRPTWSIPGGDIYIGGSLTLAPTMNVSAASGVNFNFVAESGDHTVTTEDEDGDGFDLKNIIFDGGNSWTLGGAMYASEVLTFKNGTFSTSSAHHNFEATTITVNGSGVTLNLNNSELFSTTFNILEIGTLNSAGSNIYTENFDITPAGLIFNELFLRGDEGVLTGTDLIFLDVNLSNDVKSTIYGSHTYNRLLQLDRVGMIVEFEAGTTHQIANLEATGGDCGEEIIVRTTLNGSAVNFVATDGDISVSGIIIQDNSATPDLAFSASGSQNLGNVSGWDFTSMAQTRYFYWRGDTGDWNDGSNWRYTDTPGGNPTTPNCIPTPSDDVFFDADSFKDPNEVITLDGVEQYCRNMTWGDDITGLPTMSIPAGNSLNIYGSLRLANTGLMALSFGDGEDATLEFKASTTGHTINPSGQVIPNLEFDGAGGAWSFSGVASLEVGNAVTIINGTLNTNGIDLLADQFVIDGPNAAVSMGSSELNIVKKFEINEVDPMNVDAGTSIITTNNLESDIEAVSFNEVVMSNDPDDVDANPTLNGNNLIFNSLILNGESLQELQVLGSHRFNQNLQFHVASGVPRFKFESGSTQTLGSEAMLLRTSDVPEAPAFVEVTGATSATFLKESGATCTDYLRITSVNASPEGAFGLINGTSSVTDATGWVFTDLSCEAFLPVDCIDFAAAVQTDNSVELYWITAQEVNNDGFEVQRSTNGRSFETIAWVDGAGTTSEAQKYTFVDSRTNGLTEAYYRIQQIDFDGTAAFACDIQAVNFRAVGSGPVQVFPNPAGSQVQVRWYGRKDGTTIIRLFDQSGRLVLDREWNTLEGNNQRELPINELPQGIYELQVVSEHGLMETARLVKQ